MNSDTLERVKWTTWLYSCHLFPKIARLSAKRDHLFLIDREERECLSENLASSEVQTLPKRSISLSAHPEYWVMISMTRRYEGAERVADGCEGIKGMRILLKASWTPSRSPPMSHWGTFPMDPRQLIRGTHKAPYVPATHITTLWSALCVYSWWHQELALANS